MNYKKKYKEAERLYQTANADQRYVLESLFPELKEPEDERIRKDLIGTIHLAYDCGVSLNKEQHDKAIAWLEKKGGQKLYVNDNTKEMFIRALERVEEQNNKGYKLTDCDKNSWWEDFKAYTSCIIEQKLSDKVEPKFKVGDLIRNKWSNHSKEIVAVDDCQYTLNDGMPAPPFKVAIKEQDNWELVEQKPTWSEEDEVMIKVFDSIIRYIVEVVDKDVLERFGTSREELFSWLKSLKQRIKGE